MRTAPEQRYGQPECCPLLLLLYRYNLTELHPSEKIPAAFIITGPNLASQQLLFEQLAESLQDASPAKVICLRSAEAPNLKATLKKIIRDATSRVFDGEEDFEVSVGQDVSHNPRPSVSKETTRLLTPRYYRAANTWTMI